MCAICYIDTANDYTIHVCHLLYEICKWIHDGHVQFVVQTQIQGEQEKFFPGSKAAEVYSWKLTSIKCEVLCVEFYLLFAKVPSQPAVRHTVKSFFKLNIHFCTSGNNIHYITPNEEYK
jgi:hypothetical protein